RSVTRTAVALALGCGLALASAPSQASAAASERVWLVVGASETTPAAIVHKAQRLASAGAPKGGLVFQSKDCGDKKAGFGWAGAIASSADAANEELARLRTTVKDAFIKRCDVRPKSLL